MSWAKPFKKPWKFRLEDRGAVASSPPPTTSDPTVERHQPVTKPTEQPPDLSTSQKLWNNAYESLENDNDTAELVSSYMKTLATVLRAEAPKTSASGVTDVSAELDDLSKRQMHMKKLVKEGLEKVSRASKATKGAGEVAEFILSAKGMIDLAIQNIPQAALPWAGVCIGLQILLNPAKATKSNLVGITHVVSRMDWYGALTEHLLKENNIVIGNESFQSILQQLEMTVVALYKALLLYQMKSVCSYYLNQGLVFLRGLTNLDDWDGDLKSVTDAEDTLQKDSDQYSSQHAKSSLRELLYTAEKTETMLQRLLSVAEQQLQVTQQQRDISSEELRVQKKIAKFTENTNEILGDIRDRRPAINLPTVDDAHYNSADVQDNPKCQEDTRVSIQNQITIWANSVESETIFWLSGPAGTGKSTIARTVANSFKARGQLAAGYFFKRGEQDRNGTAKFFSTIASQLTNIPMFNTYLRESLEKLGNVKIEKTALKEQFETLLLTPLSAILPDDSGMMTRIIIIDALDECERYDHIPEILKMLAQLRGLRNVRFRVFLTCRSAPRIVSAFNDLNTQPGIYRCLALEKEFNKETKADISAFLRKTFANIRTKSGITIDPWPDPKDLNRLVSLATNPSPLFIYAATLCRFVYDEDDDWADPTERLNLWLAQCDRNVSQLEQIYKPILEQSFSGRYKEGQNTKHLNSERQSKVLQILGTIVLLTTPLPAGALATLLGIHKDAVNRCLRNLHAVLSVPSEPNAPVRVLHKSFSDFLLGQEGTGTADFQVDAVEIHAMLALKCIDSMNNGLRRDICNLQESGKLRVEIDKAIVARHIPPDLEYACLHWVYHLHSGQRTIDENIYAFLQQHFLHWIESLSLLGKLSDGVRSIRKLLYIAQLQSGVSPRLAGFLKDAEKFVLSHGSIIERAPMQTYGSALVFSPMMSEVKHAQWKEKLSFIKAAAGIGDRWGTHQQTLEGHGGVVFAVAFSPDGQMLASASYDKTVRLWDATTGVHQQTLKGHRSFVNAVAFSPDGQALASASDDKTVRLWDAATGAHQQTFKGYGSYVNTVAFSPDGKTLALAPYNKTVWLCDAVTGAHQQTLKGHDKSVFAVAFSPDGQTLASASYDKTIRLWDAAAGVHQQTLKGHRRFVNAVAFSPDGQTLASASDDKTVRLWDTATGMHQQTLKGHDDSVIAVAFSLDGQMLASASDDKTVRLWDAATGARQQTLKGHDGSVTDVAFSPDSQTLASASYDKTVRLWDAATGVYQQTPKRHGGSVYTVAFSPDGQTLASASYDKTVRLWDAGTGIHQQTLKGHGSYVNTVAFSPDGRTLALTLANNTVWLWNTATGVHQQTLKGYGGHINAVAFSPDGQTLASASSDETVQLWDTATGVHQQTLKGHGGSVTAVAFSPDGQTLASASNDLTVRLWEIVTGVNQQTLKGKKDFVTDVAFSPDGQMLASASYDKTVQFWGGTTSANQQMLKNREDYITDVAFSPDGQTLALASADHTVQLWDTSTGAHQHTLKTNQYPRSLAFSEDGRYLKTDSGSLRISSESESTDMHVDQNPSDSSALLVDNEWITRDGKNLLWLPKDYRAACVTTYNDTVALGHESGGVTFLQFDFS